jgi:hypothetical protein
VDEVSLLLVPGIDGCHEIPAVFDGVSASRKKAAALKLKSVEQRGRGTLWIRYEVVRAKTAKRRSNSKGDPGKSEREVSAIGPRRIGYALWPETSRTYSLSKWHFRFRFN